ncbi:MAG: ABC transporter substrate-binding protein [Bacteroidota bacterium]
MAVPALFSSPRVLFVLGLSVLVAACQPQTEEAPAAVATDTAFDPGADYFPDKVTVEHAEHFSVSYHGHYKVVRTHAEVRAWQSDDPPEATEDVTVLVQRGTPVPPLTGDLAEATVLTIPAATVALNNDGTLAFVEALDRVDQVVAVGGLSIYDDDLRRRAESGEIGTVGYSWHGEPKLEVMLTVQPDIALMTVDDPSNVKSLGRARELGVAAAPTFEWAEPHYLGRAEWVKYTSLFFNAEAEANALFEEVTSRVAALRAEVADQPHAPTTLWGYYSGNGRWMMHQNNLEARLLADAGGINPFEDFDGDRRNDGEPIASEQLLVQGADADHWIIGDIHSADLPPATYMDQFAAWRTGALYHNYKRTKWEHNAYDYYKTALVRPDRVLADLIALLHPEVLPDHETVYLGSFSKP